MKKEIKLNLGCGNNYKNRYNNVDKYGVSFINDPAHLRKIAPEGIELFSKSNNEKLIVVGLPQCL